MSKIKKTMEKRGRGRPANPDNADGRWQIYLGIKYRDRVLESARKSKRTVRAEVETAIDRYLGAE